MTARKDIDAVLELLAERFPRAFFLYERKRVPLKVGIRDDLMAALGDAIDRKLLGVALRQYFKNIGYQYAVKAGHPRFDLDGNVAGNVSEQEAEHARRSVAGLRAMRAQQKQEKLRIPPRITLEAAPETAPPPPPAPEPPKRLGLADLKAAAQRRKAAMA